jgi:hypothetical protein
VAEDVSWEEIVNRVTMASNYHMVQGSADLWQVTFERIEKVATALRDLARQSKQSWTGPGANAFYDHIGALAKALDEIKRRHEGIVSGLRACGDDLEAAVRTIPVPPWMEGKVRGGQSAYAKSGVADDIAPNAIRSYLYQKFPASERYVEEYMLSYSSTAHAAYDRLKMKYEGDLAKIPRGEKVPVPGVNRDARKGTGKTNGASGQSKTPGTGSGLPSTTGLPTAPAVSGLPNPSSGALPPGLNIPPPSIPDYSLPDLSTPDLPRGLSDLGDLGGSSLAGAGDFGAGGGGGGSLGLPAIGPLAHPSPAMVAANDAMAGGQGRLGGPGSGSGVTGQSNSAVGVTPGAGAAAGHPGQGGETGTQLHEDDKQMFGSRDHELPGGVLD